MNNSLDYRFLELMRSLKLNNEYYKKLLSKINISAISPDKLYELIPYNKRINLQELSTSIYTPTNEEIYIEMTTGTTGIPLRCPKNVSERIKLSFDIWKKRRSIDPQVTPKNFYLLYGSSARKVFNFFDYDVKNLNNCFKFLHDIRPRWLCGSVSAFHIYAQEIDSGRLKNNIDSLRFIELKAHAEEKQSLENIFLELTE